MTTSNPKVLLLGLPESGKTSFLAALWHLIQDPAESCALTLSQVRGDRAYLNRIRERWVRCEDFSRTVLRDEKPQPITICMYDSRAKREIDLEIPDPSGEHFEQHLTHRQWSATYDHLAHGASGAMVFVHPDKIRKAPRLDAINMVADGIDSRGETTARDSAVSNDQGSPVQPLPHQRPETASDETAAPWSYEHVPTAVQLVDLLQCVMSRRPQDVRLRVSLVISAWDLLTDIPTTPMEVFRIQLPLLWQFLTSRLYPIEFTVLGVSAMGGSPDADRVRLLDHRRPTERIKIVGLSDCGPHDLTAPIAWLLG